MINFPIKYFDAETRDDFFIESMMKRAWAVQIDLLQIIDEICKDNHITYFADSGTLLGAVRHKGFIPWDDDIDIAMTRTEYNRFISIAEAELKKVDSNLRLHTVYNEESYTNCYARVVNSHSINFGKEHMDRWYGCPYIVGIDVFPMDNLPKNKDEETVIVELIKTLLYVSLIWDNSSITCDKKELLESTISLINKKIDYNGNVRNQILRIVDELCTLYNNDSDELTCYPFFINNSRLRFPAKCYQKVVQLPFENIIVPAPADYDTVLKAEYGDYMTPVRGGADHEYPFYKDQRKIAQSKGLFE